MDLSKASKLIYRFSSVKSRLPNLLITNEFSLTLYSIIPCFDCLTVSSKSSGFTKVPDLTFGMSPFGPSTLANPFNPFMNSGVAIILSKASCPFSISFNRFSSPIMSVFRALSYSWNCGSAKTATLISLPVPAGSTQVPLIFWSPWVGSTLSLMMSSKDSLNLRSLEAALIC